MREYQQLESRDSSTIVQQMNIKQGNQNRFGNVFLQEQLNNGSAIVVGSAANSEVAFDDSFSPHLLKTLQENPNESLDDVLTSLDNLFLTKENNEEHHSTIAQYGKQDSENRTNNKHAVLIANQNYRYENPLGTPILEANQMASELESRNYETEIVTDQDAAGMESAWMSMIKQANSGDELVAFFGGHGKKEGLVGVEHTPAQDDILENSLISSMVQMASSQGKHIRFIMDSCHSGAAVENVREDYSNTFNTVQTTEEQDILLEALKRTQTLKDDLMERVELRESYVDTLKYYEEPNVLQQYHQNQFEIKPSSNPSQEDAYDFLSEVVEKNIKPQITSYDQGFETSFAYYFEEIGEVHTLISKVSGIELALPPKKVTEYKTLGRQIDYCDELMNTILKLL